MLWARCGHEAIYVAGSPASVAVSELIRAGAKCSLDDDLNDPLGYVCIWTRPGYSLSYFLTNLEWIIGIETNFKENIVVGVSAYRGETGF